ncbi:MULTISPECIES: hypothetical protein [Mycolicibacterium]|uniref:hypothetical protein n=1 Tax=Mycolicibacterium TaxID=1866885 RepID=UPI001490579D|nr:hypothetical protein [Mycolicibacterium fortuitum]
MGKQRPVLAALMAAVGAAALYTGRIRPWMYHWGATVAEINTELPGDNLVCPDAARTTRAVTVGAPVETVWSWLSRIGQGGNGHYTYRWLERNSPTDSTSCGTIHPQWQQLRVGDVIWLARRYGPTARQVVAAVRPGAYVVLVSGRDFDRIQRGEKASAAWGVYVRRTGSLSRLLIRGSGGLTGQLGFDVARFAYDLSVLRSIHTRARHISPPPVTSLTTACTDAPDSNHLPPPCARSGSPQVLAAHPARDRVGTDRSQPG